MGQKFNKYIWTTILSFALICAVFATFAIIGKQGSGPTAPSTDNKVNVNVLFSDSNTSNNSYIETLFSVNNASLSTNATYNNIKLNASNSLIINYRVQNNDVFPYVLTLQQNGITKTTTVVDTVLKTGSLIIEFPESTANGFNCVISLQYTNPAMTTNELKFYQLMSKLNKLEGLAKNYIESQTDTTYTVSQLVYNYIRCGNSSYTDTQWTILIGSEIVDFTTYVEANDSTFATWRTSSNLNAIVLPDGNIIDFSHMFATLECSRVEKGVLGGWGGDLASVLVAYVNDVTYNITNIGEGNNNFGSADMYADLDAVKIFKEWNSSEISLARFLLEYYYAFTKQGVQKPNRITYFIENVLDGTLTTEKIKTIFNNDSGVNTYCLVKFSFDTNYKTTYNTQIDAVISAFAAYLNANK